MVSFTADAWVKNSCCLKFFALLRKTFLQSRSSGLVKANVQDQLFLRHGISIPEGLDLAGSDTNLLC
jgi:hypothetical protein